MIKIDEDKPLTEGRFVEILNDRLGIKDDEDPVCLVLIEKHLLDSLKRYRRKGEKTHSITQEKRVEKEQEDADKPSQRATYGNRPPPARKPPLTKKEVAARLGISVSHLENVRKFEDFPKPSPLIRGGRKIGWDEDELEQWIAKEWGRGKSTNN